MSYHGEAKKPDFQDSTSLLATQIHNKISKTTSELSEAELSAVFLKYAKAVNMTKKTPENKHSNASKLFKNNFFHKLLN